MDLKKVMCGALRAADEGASIRLEGWVNRRRDHGGLIFIDLRDYTGITQIVFDPQHPSFTEAERLRSEDVIRIDAAVRRRPKGTENPRLATGEIEVGVTGLDVINKSHVPPFQINVDEAVDENLRLEYRYLDLRRPHMQRNLRIRHRVVKALRDFYDARGFVEIETPMLMKSTPEGARDYIVPSRIFPGTFYALPQSPQLPKQISMIAGFGRYMQIARCMRDEDLRADRQPEFTQLDVELSFTTQEEVIETLESSIRHVWKEAAGIELPAFPRLTYDEAMSRYGSDKPDLRFGLELVTVNDIFAQTEFVVFKSAIESGGSVVGIRFPGGAEFSRRDFDALTELAKQHGAKGLVWIALGADGVKSPAAKFLPDDVIAKLCEATGAHRGTDALLLFAGPRNETLVVAGRMRNEIGERCGLRDPEKFAFAWVTGFPYLEINEETGKPAPSHHPFTSPGDGEWDLIDSDPLAMRAQHYDMVLNGFELGSGSIRIHQAEQQRRIFHMLGMSDEVIEERFGFFMKALEYGAPPHGGMALGIDRIAMLICGETSIREVIAFPKNQAGRDLMMNSPTSVSEQQLKELHLKSTAPPPS